MPKTAAQRVTAAADRNRIWLPDCARQRVAAAGHGTATAVHRAPVKGVAAARLRQQRSPPPTASKANNARRIVYRFQLFIRMSPLRLVQFVYAQNKSPQIEPIQRLIRLVNCILNHHAIRAAYAVIYRQIQPDVIGIS